MAIIRIIGAALWGAAEASFFFIVPDVLLTFATVRFGLKTGLRLAASAAVSAALAGTMLWLWSHHDPASARAAMLWVPAVGPDLLARAHREIGGAWPLPLVIGALSGVPYKLYAVEAGARGIPLYLFLPMSVVARLLRFSLTVALTAAGGAIIKSRRAMTLAWALAWIAVYVVYFSLRAMA